MAVDKTYKNRLKSGEKILFTAIQPEGKDLHYWNDKSTYPYGCLHVNSNEGGVYLHLTKSVYDQLKNVQSGDEFVMGFLNEGKYGQFTVDFNVEEVDNFVPFTNREPNYSVKAPTKNNYNRPPAQQSSGYAAPAPRQQEEPRVSTSWDDRLAEAAQGMVKGCKVLANEFAREMPDLELTLHGLLYGVSTLNMSLKIDSAGQNLYEDHKVWDEMLENMNAENEKIISEIVGNIAMDVGEEAVENDEQVLKIFNYIIEEVTGHFVGHQHLSTVRPDELDLINDYLRRGGSVQEAL